MIFTRRTALIGLGGGLLSGCDTLARNESFQDALKLGEGGNFRIQRALTDRMALAREFSAEDMSPRFRANGSVLPDGADYARHMVENFANWQLRVDGLVARPQSFDLAKIRSMPHRTQITRHDCVEGWSAIGKWIGVPLKLILDQAALSTRARYIVFHCADMMKGKHRYYESIDLIDAMHPQTILAWGLNDQILPVANGAPLRLRVERQLGYKHAKYVQHIEAVEDLSRLYRGKGGYWEDGSGYEWYAGI
jgi:DMSO/TMAO reductase YedYZ molybdopterin-dependent catalytic subunit